MPHAGRYSDKELRAILQKASTAYAKDASDEEAFQTVQYARAALKELIAQRPSKEAVEAEERRVAAPGGLASFGLGASQGATLGFGEELAGLLAGAGAVLPGGQSPAQAYRQQVAESRQAAGLAQEAHPLAYYGGDIAGSLAVPVGGGAALAGRLVPRAAPAFIRGAARVAGSGLLGGGIAGLEAAGRTEDDRLGAATQAVPYGAAAGAAIPVGGAVIGEILRPIVGAGKRIGKRLAGKAAEKEATKAVQATTKELMEAEQLKTQQLKNQLLQQRLAGGQSSSKAALGTAIGEPAIPGKPELGTLVKAGKYQKAGSPLRTKSPRMPINVSKLPKNDPQAVAGYLQQQMQFAQATGLPVSPQALERLLTDMRLTDEQLQAVLRELARRGTLTAGLLMPVAAPKSAGLLQ